MTADTLLGRLANLEQRLVAAQTAHNLELLENDRLTTALTEIRDSLASVIDRIKGGSEGALGALFLVAAANEAKAREALARSENQHSEGQK